jgi:transcriptional regulator with XRE-family HTH domain
MGPPRKLDEAQAAEMRRLWEAGETSLTLAAMFGVSTRTVWVYCERRVERPGGKTLEQPGLAEKAGRKQKRRAALRRRRRDAEVRRLWSEGWSGKRLAERFGLAKSTVSGIVAGQPSRRRYGDPEDATWPLPRRVVARPGRSARRVVPASGETIGASPMSHRGSAHGRAKLDEVKVARMKRLRLDGWTTNALAREFGVGSNTVSYVLTGRTWGHVAAASVTIGGEPC